MVAQRQLTYVHRDREERSACRTDAGIAHRTRQHMAGHRIKLNDRGVGGEPRSCNVLVVGIHGVPGVAGAALLIAYRKAAMD